MVLVHMVLVHMVLGSLCISLLRHLYALKPIQVASVKSRQSGSRLPAFPVCGFPPSLPRQDDCVLPSDRTLLALASAPGGTLSVVLAANYGS